MGATLHAGKQFLDPERPARADARPDQLPVTVGDGGTEIERRRIGAGFHIADLVVIIHRQANPHFVQRFARLNDPAAILVGERVGFGVHHVALDVPQAILAAVAGALHDAPVQHLAWNGGRERHGILREN